MSTWLHWQADLLEAANLPNTRLNRSFLTAWERSEPTTCHRNPLWISHKERGSTNCRRDSITGKHAQNYLSIGSAKAAFAAQLHSGAFGNLLNAFHSGNPYSLHDVAADLVAIDLDYWPARKFAAQYANGQNPPAGTLNAPQALAGWQSLRRSINRGMPQTLDHAQRVNGQTLRTLSRARKVRV